MCIETLPYTSRQCYTEQGLPRDAFVIFCTVRGEKGKGHQKKKQQSFPTRKEEGQNDQETGRHLSYKQEIAKIINEYSSDKAQTIQDVFGYFLSLRSHITLIWKSVSYYVTET